MAFVIADRVRETTTTTGTGTITLAGAVTNFETFTSNLSNSDTTYYSIVDNTNGAFEVGLGTFTSSGTTLARSVIASSNSNNLVNFGAGTKDVFITVPASKIVVEDGSNNVAIGGTVTATGFSGSGASLTALNVSTDSTPQLGGNLDTNSHNILIDDAHFIADENGNEQIIFQTTSSAVNQLDVTNAATGSGPTISSTGGDTNINLNLTPKGSGVVLIDGQVGIEAGIIDLKNSGSTVSKILFYCESSNAHAQTLIGAPHSETASNTLTLPSTGGNSRLLSAASTATLTNKTFGDNVSFGDNNITNVGDIAVDSISADGTDINVAVSDNSATAFTIKQGSDNYLVVDTANSSESVAIGTGISGTAVSIGHTTSETTVNDNLTVTGNFTVNGTTTTVDTTNTTVKDSLLELNSGATSNSNDCGVVIERGSTGDNAIIMWDESGDTFVVGTTTATGASTGNLTVTDGALQAGSLDISGNVDVDGTLEADAMTLNGTAITATATLSVGISNTNVAQFGSGVADNDYLKVNGTTIEGRSEAEVLSDIGATTATAAANEATALAIALG